MQHLKLRLPVGIPDEKLAQLTEISPNATIFTSLPSSKRDKPESEYDTATAEENEDSLLSEPLTSFFDHNAINIEGCYCKNLLSKNFQIMKALSNKIYMKG